MVLHCAVCHKLKTLFPALPRESPDHRAGAAAVAVAVAASAKGTKWVIRKLFTQQGGVVLNNIDITSV